MGFLFSLMQAQENEFNLSFQSITSSDGLSDNRFNYYVNQDSKGFVWISSMNGLNRFDGINVKVYNVTDGLADGDIQSTFFEDKHSNIWFSTFTGLNCYIRSEDRIKTIPINYKNGDPIVNDFIVFHLDKSKDRLWLKADTLIFGLNINQPEHYFPLPIATKGSTFEVKENSKGYLKKIMSCSWGNADGMDLIELEDSNFVVTNEMFSEFPIIKRVVSLIDSNWVFFANKQLHFFSDSTPENLRSVEIEKLRNVNFIKSISDSIMVISTSKNGLFRYNWKRNSIENHWMHQEKNPNSILDNSPQELAVFNNMVWTSHRSKGVIYSYMNSNSFENPLANSQESNNEITSIIEVQNTIWATTSDRRIFAFNKKTNQIEKTLKLPNDDTSNIWNIMRDNSGVLFLTTLNQIFYFDEEKQSIEEIQNPDQLNFWTIKSFNPNRTIVSTSQGLFEIMFQHNKYVLKPCEEFKHDPSFRYFQMLQTESEIVYIPYDWSKLLVYKSSGKGLKKIKTLDCDLQFYGFCESKRLPNTTWACTTKGIYQITNDTILQKVFSKEIPELRNVTAYSMLEDLKTGLWVTTNKGLLNYNFEDKKWVKYEEEDGLVSSSFSQFNSAIQTDDGKFWFGTDKGLVTFNPRQIKPFVEPPNVFMDQLIINDQDTISGIGVLDSLKLKHDKNTLAFNILPITYYKAKKSKIKFWLENYDDKWITQKQGQQIRYTKIPFGNYNLKYKAIDANGNESETQSLQILINPPFYRTYWFYLLSFLIGIASVYFLYKTRISQIKKKEREKTALAELEFQVVNQELKALRAQMNPHFLFNAMNSIKGIIIKNDIKNATEYLTKLSSLIRAILQNSEKKLIPLSKELEALKLYIELESLRFTTDFHYQLKVDKNIDQAFTRILPLVFQPFVENAIWHGLIPKENGEKNLNILLLMSGDNLVCEIEDNGVGRKKSAEVNQSKEHKSMGIAITQKRIKMHHPNNDVQIVDMVDNNNNPIGTKVILVFYTPE